MLGIDARVTAFVAGLPQQGALLRIKPCAKEADPATAAMAKYWCSDLQCKVIDECLQLHGGYGYMWEYPIARAFADARVQRIYGGTNEIMKEVITRAMGLGAR